MDGQSMNCGKRSVKSGSRRRKNGERVTAVFLAGCILFSLAGSGRRRSRRGDCSGRERDRRDTGRTEDG